MCDQVPTDAASPGSSTDFLSGGGEVAALIRSRDWSDSPLGPPDQWPQVLKSTVSLILPAATQIVLFWGPEFVALYNDTYAPTIGDKHPRALGRPARENWAELWDDLEPLLVRVRDGGETVSAEDRPFYIERHGKPETVYFDISYSPVRDEAGEVAGVLCLVKETTQKVLSEQRVRASEARLRNMADNLPVMVWVTDDEGRCVYLNHPWFAYTGQTEAEALGTGWLEAIHPDDRPRTEDIFFEASAKREPFRIEYRLRRADGTYRWAIDSGSPRFGAGGDFAGFVGSVIDIEERRVAEDALRESEARFRAMADSAPSPVWVTGPDGIEFVNQAFCEFAGLPSDQLMGPAWTRIIHPDDLPEVARIREDAWANGSPYGFEARFRDADGGWRWMMVNSRPRRDLAEGPIGYTGMAVDLTEMHQAVDALRSSEDRLRLATEAASVGVWDYYPKQGVLRWDPRTRAAFGLSIEAHVDYDVFLNAVHPDDRERTEAAVRLALTPDGPGGYDVEYRAIGIEDRVERWISARGRAVFENGEAVRFIGTVIDISDRKAAEAALARSEAELREQTRNLETLNSVATNLAGELDLERVVQMVTDAGVAMSGAQFGAFFYNVLNAAGESYMLYTISGVDRSEFDKFPMPRNTGVFHPTFSGEGPVRSDDITQDPRYGKNDPHYGMPEGHLPVRSYLAAPVTSRTGEVVGGLFFGHAEPGVFTERHERLLIGMAGQAAVAIDNARLFESAQREIAERRRAQEALAELNRSLEKRVSETLAERKLLADLVEGTDAMVQVVSPDFRWMAINKASADEFERIFGIRPKVGDSMLDLLADKPQHQADVRAVWSRALAGEEFTEIGEFGEPGLARRHYEMKYNVLRDPAGEQIGAYQFVYDVTERLREQERLAHAEEALRQSQKMEAVGQLTGGIAHDFNNLLTVITGNLELAQRQLAGTGNARLERNISNALTGSERAAVLTQRLLAFSRRQPLTPKPTDPNKLVTGMSDLLHRSLGETISVETVLGAGVWRIEIDPNQLENAILNLAVNARDAMEDGGKLTIETANTHLDRAYVAENSEVLPGQYVAICVTDTGVGMDADTIARAYEPFFTTKEVGKGTGLGLSMVYGFVKQSGGHVKIYSESGEGTTVKIYLPRMTGDAAEDEEDGAVPVPEGDGRETILVCEDDHDVRAYTVEVLRDLGYRVVEAVDGAAALHQLEDRDGQIDLLFTDIVLPNGMNGEALAKQARAIRPELKVLFTTGYARNAMMHQGRLDPGVELITKPFAYAELAARVRDMLDGGA